VICKVIGCAEPCTPSSPVCAGHVGDLLFNRLERTDDGRYAEKRALGTRPMVSPFVARALSHQLPGKAL
jgi:hypothetical protein